MYEYCWYNNCYVYYIFINHTFFTKKPIDKGSFKTNKGWLNKSINLIKERQFTTRLPNYFG